MKLRRLIASLVALTMIGFGTVTFSAVASATPGSTDNQWVFVCKYVGQPGVNEHLKHGKQPIRVSSNATVGTYFKDGQILSFVLAVSTDANTGQGETYTGTLTCPEKISPPDPQVVTSDWKDGTIVCDTTTVEQTRTVTTTPYVWDSNTLTWVLDTANAVVTTETRTRPLSKSEQTTCPVDVTYITPTAPSIVDPTCSTDGVLVPGTYSIPEQTGVAYTIGGTKVDPGVYNLTATVTIMATLTGENTEWTAGATTSWTLHPVANPDCVKQVEVTAVFPEPVAPTCTVDGALPALPTDQTGITFSWDSENHLTMVATALPGYVLTGDTSRTYAEPGEATGDCYVSLEPVTVAPATCQVGDGGVADITGGSITLPTTAGVTYTVKTSGGEPVTITDGKATGLAAGDYVITATPAEGKILTVGDTAWKLQEDGTATMTVTVDPATDCAVPQPDPKVTATEWVDGTWACDATTVMQTREVTTTPYTWVDGAWVLDSENATTVTETQTRDLLPSEQTVCAEVLAAPPNASVTIVAPTCTADGSATLVNGEHYTWDKTSFGPGQWTATATVADGYAFDNGSTYQVTFLVSPKLTGSACSFSQVLAAPPNASVPIASTAVLAATGATPLPLAIIAIVLIGAGVVLQPRVRRTIFTRH